MMSIKLLLGPLDDRQSPPFCALCPPICFPAVHAVLLLGRLELQHQHGQTDHDRPWGPAAALEESRRETQLPLGWGLKRGLVQVRLFIRR